MSEAAGDREKGGACVRHALWTQARTSEKVGTVLTYQAARRGRRERARHWWWATRMSQLKRPSRTGVVRAMAAADHWRWVSTPRWVRERALYR